MSRCSFQTELCEPGCWPVGFFLPSSGEEGRWPNVRFIHLTLHPPCYFPWLPRFNLRVKKSNLSNKIKHNFFQAVVVSILYGCTTWTLTKRIEKKLDGNRTRMLRAILNKSSKQYPIKQLYGYVPSLSKTIQVRRTRHAGHCWRSKDELISNILLWTSTHGRASLGRPTRTYLQQLCKDTGCNLEDPLEAMDDRNEWWKRERERKRGRETCAHSTTWSWWWFLK